MKYAALLPTHPIAASVVDYAMAFGQDFYAVFRAVPFVHVLLAVYLVHDRERIARLFAQGDLLEAGVFASYAFNEPKLLSKEQSRYRLRLSVDPMLGSVMASPAVQDALRTIREARERGQGS